MLDIDCDIVAGDWDEQFDWDGLALRAISAALGGAGFTSVAQGEGAQVEISVRLSDDDEVQRLNRDYRGKDKPTNILSFPMLEPADVGAVLARQDMDLLLGDMAMAYETTAREAEEKGIDLADHVTHLLVHGTLHLLGHDHQDDATADAMEALETAILAGIGIANPYTEAPPLAVDERS